MNAPPDDAVSRKREARRWLSIVVEDIDVANAAARLPRPGAAAYHLQQAAEKIVKALLVLNGEPFRRTHDLDDLVTRLAPSYPQFASTLDAFRSLPFGVWPTDTLVSKSNLKRRPAPRNWTGLQDC
jgi:hypothetical protein